MLLSITLDVHSFIPNGNLGGDSGGLNYGLLDGNSFTSLADSERLLLGPGPGSFSFSLFGGDLPITDIPLFVLTAGASAGGSRPYGFSTDYTMSIEVGGTPVPLPPAALMFVSAAFIGRRIVRRET